MIKIIDLNDNERFINIDNIGGVFPDKVSGASSYVPLNNLMVGGEHFIRTKEKPENLHKRILKARKERNKTKISLWK